jgi:putative ABC transport system permease protein
MQQIIKSVSIALKNIRANPLHTFLSTLGMIIGVASLVAILALGDGLEQTGREQIESTTNVQMMNVSPKTIDVVNEVRVPRDTVYAIDLESARAIQQQVEQWGFTELFDESSRMATYGDSARAIYIQSTLGSLPDFDNSTVTGRFFSSEEIKSSSKKIVLTLPLARHWADDTEQLLGDSIRFDGHTYEVIGIYNDDSRGPRAIIPMPAYLENLSGEHSPSLVFKSRNVEKLPEMKASVEQWLDETFEEGREAFTVFTYEGRVEQFRQGILIFKLVMGAITGISVLVGGIGIMNVLLISVTERTKEIGIRKAAGAQKKDIVMQFLSESVTISIAGSILGWVVGVAGLFGLVEIINRLTDLTFRAALSLDTVLIVAAVAVFIGIVFGTYPAWKAAKLTPVDAIRHE